jgi:hypothetical protein
MMIVCVEIIIKDDPPPVNGFPVVVKNLQSWQVFTLNR